MRGYQNYSISELAICMQVGRLGTRGHSRFLHTLAYSGVIWNISETFSFLIIWSTYNPEDVALPEPPIQNSDVALPEPLIQNPDVGLPEPPVQYPENIALPEPPIQNLHEVFAPARKPRYDKR